MTTAKIDPGDASTWPESVRVLVDELAAEIEPVIEDRDDYPACDLPHLDTDRSERAELELRAALTGHRLVVWHATRLLPGEVDDICGNGVAVLDDDLVDRKLAAVLAHDPSVLTDAESDVLRRFGPCHWQRTSNVRVGFLFVFTPLSYAHEDPGGLAHLVGTWGGEAIGWTDDGDDPQRTASSAVARLTRLSTPTLLKLAVPAERIQTFKTTWPTFVGQRLDLGHAHFESAINAPVPAGDVLGVIQPSDPLWPPGVPTD